MVMAVQKQEEPAIRVDQGRKYPTSAGQCDKCGYFKTWAFRVLNPKTGKQVPGHVTKEGFKINDGDCPYYALLAQRASARADQAPGEDPAPAPAPTPAPARAAPASAPRPAAAVATRGSLAIELRDGEIVARIGSCTAMVARADAAALAKVLVDLLAG